MVGKAVADHAHAVAAADGDITQVFQASDRLLPALLAYADAQFNLTGNAFPFGLLAEWVDNEDTDDEADETGEEWPVEGLSVLQRHDYTVTDFDAVMRAGRQAFLRAWPDDTEEEAARDVTHLGRALYQLAHADGLCSLAGVEGLEPVAGIVGVVRQCQMLGPDPDDWDDAVFDDEDEVLFSQADVYRPHRPGLP